MVSKHFVVTDQRNVGHWHKWSSVYVLTLGQTRVYHASWPFTDEIWIIIIWIIFTKEKKSNSLPFANAHQVVINYLYSKRLQPKETPDKTPIMTSFLFHLFFVVQQVWWKIERRLKRNTELLNWSYVTHSLSVPSTSWIVLNEKW